jgi:F-type H+-transporting ATPase subunit delta
LRTAFADLINDNLLGFLQLLIEKNRETVLITVLDDYINKANKHLGRVVAKIVSATALSDKQMARMLPLVAKLTNKEIKIINVVDPDVIGGFYILVDGYVFDATIRSELHKMKEQLKKGGLNAS